jgi:hypothetical protein
MIERDYIMRMISQLTQFLTRVLLHKSAYDFPLARRELDAAYKSLLGFDPGFIRQFSDDQIISMFGQDEHIRVAKCYALGSLMKEEGELLLLQGESAGGEGELLRSLNLLLTAFTLAGNEAESGHNAKIENLLVAVRGSAVPVDIRGKLMVWYEMTGRFARAEDVLFELVADDPHWKEAGVAMYKRLMTLPDAELVTGGLSRVEVLESMKELR